MNQRVPSSNPTSFPGKLSVDPSTYPEDLQAIAALVQDAAIGRKDDCLSLLSLLRLLEALHRDIREHLFQDTLPRNRQNLYALLRDIEANGGWPYIHRMKIRRLLDNVPMPDDSDSSPLV
ncbi:MAG: hypothetical protein WBA43_11680 [Elainellaceae cyanobacterium]